MLMRLHGHEDLKLTLSRYWMLHSGAAYDRVTALRQRGNNANRFSKIVADKAIGWKPANNNNR